MKKGILVVSFGTSYEETRKVTIEAIEKKVQNTFIDYEVRRAFTSKMIIKKLKNRDNIHVDTAKEALDKMKEEGFTDVIVQPLHVIPGSEYYNIKVVVDSFLKEKTFHSLVLGKPLLYGSEDYSIAIEALKTQLPKLNQDKAVVLMGHGSEHPSNACYSMFQYMLNLNGLSNVMVATVEGFPELHDIMPQIKDKNVKEITLMPFMLVAGDHAINDMASDEEDSWKSILEGEGYNVNTHLKGLGENENIRNIYVNHVVDCINSVE